MRAKGHVMAADVRGKLLGCVVHASSLHPRRYFSKLLAEADKGDNAVTAPPPPPRSRRADLEAPFDSDLETVGAVLEGSRLYVLGALYIAGQGASWVLLKASSCSRIRSIMWLPLARHQESSGGPQSGMSDAVIRAIGRFRACSTSILRRLAGHTHLGANLHAGCAAVAIDAGADGVPAQPAASGSTAVPAPLERLHRGHRAPQLAHAQGRDAIGSAPRLAGSSNAGGVQMGPLLSALL